MKSLAFFLVGTMVAQAPQADIAKLLASGRGDLWVFGADRDTNTGSVSVELRSWKVPAKSWGATGAISAPSELLYSERPKDWDWANRPARQLHGDFYYHLSKYDDRSAFSSDWGTRKREDGTYSNEGSILRFEGGHLKLIANGLKQARHDYDLNEHQNFLGMVGEKIFYFDLSHGDRIFFFEKTRPSEKFEVIVPIKAWWPQGWKLDSVEQVFEAESANSVMAFVWAKNTAWISAKPRRSSMGIPVDLKTAKPMQGAIK